MAWDVFICPFIKLIKCLHTLHRAISIIFKISGSQWPLLTLPYTADCQIHTTKFLTVPLPSHDHCFCITWGPKISEPSKLAIGLSDILMAKVLQHKWKQTIIPRMLTNLPPTFTCTWTATFDSCASIAKQKFKKSQLQTLPYLVILNMGLMAIMICGLILVCQRFIMHTHTHTHTNSFSSFFWDTKSCTTILC